MSETKTSNIAQKDPLLEADHEDILDESQEDAERRKVVDDRHLEEELDDLNSIPPSSQDL